jgi:2-methylcitrate dehydratase PrpD
MGITEILVRFCYQLSGETLPRDVVEKTKSLALDFIGAASRGSLSESSLAIARFLQAVNGIGEAIVIGTPLLAHPTYARWPMGPSPTAWSWMMWSVSLLCIRAWLSSQPPWRQRS